MESGSDVVKLLLQGTFVLALSVFLLSWLGDKLSRLYARHRTQANEGLRTEEPTAVEQYKSEHSEIVQRLQKAFDDKSHDYKERILLPREEERRKKKEEEYQRFLGPAWKGEGFAVGGDSENAEDSDSTVPENRRAANRRVVPQVINQEVQAAAVAAAAAADRQKKTKVIVLPEEPSEDSPGVVTVKLRTPLGTVCTRRFHKDNTVQILLDYMTTQGFSQRVYTISTSYPRRLLDDPQQLISELGLGLKMALNIEEKD